jgi:asparagine synthase (glutamine-hydrolysing)
MCGITGIINFKSVPADAPLIHRMCDLITHRGPDDDGFFFDGPVGLGMRRLSIIDVAGGRQPIANEDGTLHIVFNGEIYNFQELRQRLQAQGHRFATNSDTETILHLYEEKGEACVESLNGMFAFALWDAKRCKLFIARDRLGKKPLHYLQSAGGLAFSSEIAPLLEVPGFQRRVNLTALSQYLRLWYVPAPLTMFQGIYKLPPGHTLVVENGQVRIQRYWDVNFSDKLELSEEDWCGRLFELIDDAVKIRMISEVPLGAFLSGGLDSSAVVALMSRHSTRPIKTFSLGFDDPRFNELPHALEVARHLGSEHHEEVIRPNAAEVLPTLVRHYGEPFGDESCIPTYYVARMARKHVTVALSGDGGDENFGGYPRLKHYLAFNPLDSIRGLLSTSVRNGFTPDSRPGATLAARRGFISELGFRVQEILDPMERYTHEWIVWKDGIHGLLSRAALAQAPRRGTLAPLELTWQRTKGWTPIDRLLYLEMMTYLPDDLQVKMDIASMAVSLEVRSPLLDYRLIELTAKMPAELKFRQTRTKYLFRKMVEPLLPPAITQRAKWGFSMPIRDWLKDELKPMVQDLILSENASDGLFNHAAVTQIVNHHLAGEFDYSRHLWLLLNFELWQREFAVSI